MVTKHHPVGTRSNEIKRNLLDNGAQGKPYSNLCTKSASIRFGATKPVSFIPEITEGQHIDASPQIQKARGGRVWQINDDLSAINQQIEGQLGHTLGGRGKKTKTEI